MYEYDADHCSLTMFPHNAGKKNVIQVAINFSSNEFAVANK